MRYPQIKNLGSVEELRARLDELGLDLAVHDRVDPAGPLAAGADIVDGGAGVLRAPNRFAVLPMEGWDAGEDGAPTDLVRRRWQRFAASGCGLVWAEATAVRRDGRANPHQLVLDEEHLAGFAELRALFAPSQVVGLQLTHSGRWSRPEGAPSPMVAYRHPYLDARVGGAPRVFTDDELDELVEDYVRAAVLAARAGFDFVDVKHCHGYLLHELLSATGRPGRYGGDLSGRTRFLRRVVEGIRDRAPTLAIGLRLSVFDLQPYVEGPDGVGVPEPAGSGVAAHVEGYPHAFGGDGSGTGIDLEEPHALLDLVRELGIGLVSTTAGSPYYNPHVQRPAAFPPSDGYRPPEDPLVGVARQIRATAELAARHPEITFVGAGYSYLQDWLPHVASAVVGAGEADMVGLGRMALSYPDLAADVLAGEPLRRRLICRTFSDCTTAPRNGLISGCYPLDPFYKERPERVQLARIKRAQRRGGD